MVTRDPALTPGGADGSAAPTRPSPSGRPSPSPSPTGVTRTLGPPSEDYALHGRLALDGGEFEMVPSTVPPVASAAAVMRAYRALSTSQAAYAAAKPTFKYGVLWKACCATELKPRLGTIVWIVGNDTVEVHGSGPASARGQKPPGPVTSHGAYSVFDGTTGAVLIGFTD